ncbi:butyrophilin-like protein 2 [Mycteria americana]|uniref:butyrophilin-like protein 2 n=1 Tax=Mycteria americana TaxID=33587 RepID=UPI003F58F0C0
MLDFPCICGQFTVHSPNNVVIQAIGEDAILPCYMSAPSIPVSLTVQWILVRALKRIEIIFFDGRSEVERQGKSYKGRTAFFTSQVRRGNLSLKLRNVQVSDKGKYTCKVAYSNWYRETYVELDVTAPYRSLPFRSPVTGVIGRDILLPCVFFANFTGNFVVQWNLLHSSELVHKVFCNGKIKSEIRGGRYKGRTELSSVELNHGNLSLVLKNVTYADKGEYVCSLDSESWHDETVVDLDVTGQFHILPPSNPIISFVGEDVILPCQLSLTGFPRSITVQWVAAQPFRTPKDISYNEAVKDSWLEERSWGGTELFLSQWSTGNLSLKLKNVQVPDKGKYICSVTAGKWHDQVAIELEVTVAIPSILTSTYVVGAVGNDVLLDCRLPATGMLANISTEWFLSRPSELIQIISYNGSTGKKIQNKRTNEDLSTSDVALEASQMYNSTYKIT